MNFKKLENNLLDMIQEQQVKIGYMSGVTRFYYPLQSLNRLLGTELTEEEMQHALEEFSDHACDRLGKVKASSKNERFCRHRHPTMFTRTGNQVNFWYVSLTPLPATAVLWMK